MILVIDKINMAAIGHDTPSRCCLMRHAASLAKVFLPCTCCIIMSNKDNKIKDASNGGRLSILIFKFDK